VRTYLAERLAVDVPDVPNEVRNALATPGGWRPELAEILPGLAAKAFGLNFAVIDAAGNGAVGVAPDLGEAVPLLDLGDGGFAGVEPLPRLNLAVPEIRMWPTIFKSVGTLLAALPMEYRAGARVRTEGVPVAMRGFATALGRDHNVPVELLAFNASKSSWPKAAVTIEVDGGRVTVELPLEHVDAAVVRAVWKFLDELPEQAQRGTRMELSADSSDDSTVLAATVALAYGVDVSGTPPAVPTVPATQSNGTKPDPSAFPDAPPQLRAAVRYQQEAEVFEAQLADYLAGLPEVNEQIAKMVKAAWDNTTDEQRPFFGTDKPGTTGTVGTDLAELQKVVDSGDLRERMAFLYSGYDNRLFAQLFNDPLERHADFADERTHRVLTREWIEYDRTKQLIDTQDISPADKQALIRALERRLAAPKTDPRDLAVPLSEAEQSVAVDEKRRLRWLPGGAVHSVPLTSPLDERARNTGALLKTGIASTMYGMLQIAELMRQRWNVPIDPALVRLAALSAMISAGDHTFDEMMRAAKLFDPKLTYSDNAMRYRHLSPLTERQLRKHVARDGKFPDEHATEEYGDPYTDGPETTAPAAKPTTATDPDDPTDPAEIALFDRVRVQTPRSGGGVSFLPPGMGLQAVKAWLRVPGRVGLFTIEVAMSAAGKFEVTLDDDSLVELDGAQFAALLRRRVRLPAGPEFRLMETMPTRRAQGYAKASEATIQAFAVKLGTTHALAPGSTVRLAKEPIEPVARLRAANQAGEWRTYESPLALAPPSMRPGSGGRLVPADADDGPETAEPASDPASESAQGGAAQESDTGQVPGTFVEEGDPPEIAAQIRAMLTDLERPAGLFDLILIHDYRDSDLDLAGAVETLAEKLTRAGLTDGQALRLLHHGGRISSRFLRALATKVGADIHLVPASAKVEYVKR
jgi:hypothetical protein